MPEIQNSGIFMSVIEQPFVMNPNCMNRHFDTFNQRNCGCSGQVTFHNATDDTLWVFIDYRPNEALPAPGSPVLESLEITRMTPDLVIFPQEETTLLMKFQRGMVYEAMPKGPSGRPEENRMRGAVRFSCMSTEVILDDEPIDEGDYYRD